MISKIVSKVNVIVCCLTVVLFSCNQNAIDQEQLNAANRKADSLSIKLNSPELKAVNAALLQDVKNDSLYNQRAIVYLSLHQFDEAVNDAKRAIRMDSTVSRYYLTLGDIYFAQNKTRLAKELLEIVVKKFPNDTEALLKLAELYFLVQKYQEGIEFVNKALRINENLAKAYYIKGSIYRESGDTSRAISSLETAIEQDSKMEDAHYDLGIIYAARKNPLAMQYYENVLRIHPQREDALYARAIFLQNLGKIDEAIAEYEGMIKIDSKCERCYYNIGALLLEIKKDPKKSIEKFTLAIEIKPDYVEAYFARGYAYSLIKDKESAKADYNMCLQLQANYPPALDGLNQL